MISRRRLHQRTRPTISRPRARRWRPAAMHAARRWSRTSRARHRGAWALNCHPWAHGRSCSSSCTLHDVEPQPNAPQKFRARRSGGEDEIGSRFSRCAPTSSGMVATSSTPVELMKTSSTDAAEREPSQDARVDATRDDAEMVPAASAAFVIPVRSQRQAGNHHPSVRATTFFLFRHRPTTFLLFRHRRALHRSLRRTPRHWRSASRASQPRAARSGRRSRREP